MEFRDKQIAAPKSWDDFESLCLALFQQIWRDPLAQKNGRRGQRQHGVDVFGSQNGERTSFCGVQCKGKDEGYGSKATVAELKSEIVKADTFQPPLKAWTFATTAPTDATLQKAAREISVARAAEGKFTVTVLGWGDIQSLLADHTPVLEAFYPEHAFDLRELVEAIRQQPTSEEVRSLRALLKQLVAAPGGARAPSFWLPVSFATKRDLGPALMGRPLGPADAASCPQLPEAQAMVDELRRAFSARLVGDAGVGKSVCAFQAARILAGQGIRILRLTDSAAAEIAFEPDDRSIPTAYLIDDAHLMAPNLLARLESEANGGRLVFSAHNALAHSTVHRGAVLLDGRRAVRVIAQALRADLPGTLQVVQRVDTSVGERPFDESLRQRIDHADKNADRPWQFCFILGGGWHRARQIAGNARAQNADIVLAAAAIRQIASRDAHCPLEELFALVQRVGYSRDAFEDACRWLVNERLFVSGEDCRTPHQRFGAVVIGEILAANADARESIAGILHAVLTDASYPLIGLYVFLDSFRSTQFGTWRALVRPEWLDSAIARCWSASSEDRSAAAQFLAEMSAWHPGWPRQVLAGHEDMVGQWISDATGGYAVARLVHNVFNVDKAYATELVMRAEVGRIADGLATAVPGSSYQLGALLKALANAAPPAWKDALKAQLPTHRLLQVAVSWPVDGYLGDFAELCSGLLWLGRTLVLDMVERALPIAAKAIAADPPRAFQEFDDIAWHILKGIDPLDLYTTRRKQTAREAKLCRKLTALLPAQPLGEKLSRIAKRNFQPGAMLLDFIRRADPEKFADIVRRIEWPQIDATVDEDWKRPFHDLEIFLVVCSQDPATHRQIDELILRHLAEMAELTPRLAIVSPNAAIRQLEEGRRIGIVSTGHFDWHMGFVIMGRLFLQRPELALALSRSLERDAARVLSNVHSSFYADSVRFIQLLRQISPDGLDRILSDVNVSTAEAGWTKALRGKDKDKQRRPIALLIVSALGRGDAVGDLARRLRARYPAASEPSPEDLETFEFKPPKGEGD